MNLTFEKFNVAEELQNQRKLFVECFPENIGTPVEEETHYRWKFHSFPSKMEQKAYEYVAKIGEDIVGYYAALPYEYVIEGKPHQVAMVCDVMTGVKARGKGVFTKLGVYSTEQFNAEGFSFSTGYPIRPDVIPGHKKAGWIFPFQIPMFGKFIRMNAFLTSRGKSFLIPFANIAISVYNNIISLFTGMGFRDLTIKHYSSKQIDAINGLDLFFCAWVKEQKIALNKSRELLRWRLGAPEKEYTIITIQQGNDIIGYAVLRKVDKLGVPCLGILDFCLLDSYKSAAYLLMGKVVDVAKKEKAELILMMMMKNNAAKYRVSRLGFIKTPYPFSFIIKLFNNAPNQDIMFDENNWSLMWIDSDDL